MIILKNFTQLDENEILLIYKWRNDGSINHFFKNKNFSFKEHNDFIANLQKDTSKKYFLVYENENAIGVINLTNINENSCEFGLYAKPNLKGKGQILINEIKKYAFEKLQIKKLKAYVYKDNEKALRLYLNNDFCVYKEDENFLYISLDKKE